MTLRHLLLLAGAGEAERLAEALDARGNWRVTVSHMHPPRLPWIPALPYRVGGFGSADGFRGYLIAEQVTAVIDATHPFARRITARVAQVCGQMGLPYLHVMRPAWTPAPGDRWTEVASEAEAAALIRPGQIAFTNTGRATLDQFAGHRAAHLYVRRLRPDQGDDTVVLPNTTVVPGFGPFSVEDEIALFRRLNVDVLITRNTGGMASRSKLDAARALGLPVILVARPPAPEGAVPDVDAALDWLDRQ